MRQAVHSSDLAHTHDPGHPADEDIEVAGIGILERRGAEEPGGEFSPGRPPRLRSMVSLRPLRSVSSRMSAISLTLPDLMSSATLSMMASTVVE